MNRFFRFQKFFIFYIFLIFFYILIFEIFCRSFVFIFTKNFDIFKFGFNKNYIFQIVDLSEFNFVVSNIDQQNITVNSYQTNNVGSVDSKKLIWTFGASLTYGFSCGEKSSSWPDELTKLNDTLIVENYAFPSQFSDDSISQLELNYNKNLTKPEIVIWTHRDEEKLSIFKGLNRNKNRLEIDYSYNQDHQSNFTILKIDKTLSANMIFYGFLNYIYDKISIKFNINNNKVSRLELVDGDYLLAMKNYEINTKDAINIAKKNNIKKFIIVSLVSYDEIYEPTTNLILKHYFDVVNNLIKIDGVYFVNTIDFIDQSIRNNGKTLFCENKHFNLKGNQIISEIINNNL